MIIDVKVDAGAYVPTKAHASDAGYDLYAIWPDIVPAKGSRTFDTGVHFAIPKGVCGLLVSKSGLNVNMGVTSTGLIDSGYTGSIKVKLYNHSDQDYHVQAGEKISQIVFLPCLDFETNLVMALANTDRGDNGFGSSGKTHPVAAGKMVGEKTEIYEYDYLTGKKHPAEMSDIISRQAAIEHLKKRLYETAFNNPQTEHPYYEEMADNRVAVWLGEVPSVLDCKECIFAPFKRKTGKWIVVSDGYGNGETSAHICECSECKDTIWVYKKAPRRWNYCPNCGAKMEV